MYKPSWMRRVKALEHLIWVSPLFYSSTSRLPLLSSFNVSMHPAHFHSAPFRFHFHFHFHPGHRAPWPSPLPPWPPRRGWLTTPRIKIQTGINVPWQLNAALSGFRIPSPPWPRQARFAYTTNPALYWPDLTRVVLGTSSIGSDRASGSVIRLVLRLNC